MIKIKTVYTFNVIDELEKGSELFYINYLNGTTKECSDMVIGQLFEAIHNAEKLEEDNPSISCFYKIVHEEEEAE